MNLDDDDYTDFDGGEDACGLHGPRAMCECSVCGRPFCTRCSHTDPDDDVCPECKTVEAEEGIDEIDVAFVRRGTVRVRDEEEEEEWVKEDRERIPRLPPPVKSPDSAEPDGIVVVTETLIVSAESVEEGLQEDPAPAPAPAPRPETPAKPAKPAPKAAPAAKKAAKPAAKAVQTPEKPASKPVQPPVPAPQAAKPAPNPLKKAQKPAKTAPKPAPEAKKAAKPAPKAAKPAPKAAKPAPKAAKSAPKAAPAKKPVKMVVTAPPKKAAAAAKAASRKLAKPAGKKSARR